MIQPQDGTSIDNYRERVSKFSSELDWGLIIFIIKKSLWFVLIFFALSLSIALIYLRYSQPEYQSSTVIQINESNQASQVLQMSKFEGTDNKIAEAMEQIRSKNFLKRVVEQSNIQVSYLNEGTFKNNELYTSSPYTVKFNIKRSSIYGVKIYIKFNQPNSGTISFAVEGKNYNLPFTTFSVINSPFFELSISPNNAINQDLRSSQLIGENKSYFVINNLDHLTANLQSKIVIN